MAADPTAPTTNIQATTNQYLAPLWVDQILRDNFFFGEVLSKTLKFRGSQEVHPIKYQTGTATVAFNGFDFLPTTQQPVTVNMTFYATFTATNVALAGSDLSVNRTQMQTIDLLAQMMKSRSQDAANDIGTFFQGSGQAFGGKAPMGLTGIVDNGSVLANYGGLSRATYNGLNATVTASGGTISLLKVRTLANAITDGNVEPTFAITDYTTWSYFEQLLQPFQRNTYNDSNFKNMKAGSGYKGGVGLYWDGLNIHRDRKITTGYFYLLNLDYLNFYGLNWWEGKPVSLESKTIVGNIYENMNKASAAKAFTWTGWIKAYNQGAINGFMIMGGQLICVNPWRNGVLTGVTGI